MQKVHKIRPGVAIVIFDDENKVLLQKRADVNLWGIPSGHVEPGETIVNAAIREVFEETGLHIEVRRLIGIYSDPETQIFKYPDGQVKHFVTCCFQGIIKGGEISTASPETIEVRFFPLKKLPLDILKMHPQWLNDALSCNKEPFIR